MDHRIFDRTKGSAKPYFLVPMAPPSFVSISAMLCIVLVGEISNVCVMKNSRDLPPHLFLYLLYLFETNKNKAKTKRTLPGLKTGEPRFIELNFRCLMCLKQKRDEAPYLLFLFQVLFDFSFYNFYFILTFSRWKKKDASCDTSYLCGGREPPPTLVLLLMAFDLGLNPM